MKDKDFKNIAEFTNVGGGLIPHNEKAKELVEQSSRGEILSFEEVTARDLALMAATLADRTPPDPPPMTK